MPDFGLFTHDQIPREGDAPDLGMGILPSRGVIEVKGSKDSAWFTAKGAQVSKYWEKYRLVLAAAILAMGDQLDENYAKFKSPTP